VGLAPPHLLAGAAGGRQRAAVLGALPAEGCREPSRAPGKLLALRLPSSAKGQSALARRPLAGTCCCALPGGTTAGAPKGDGWARGNAVLLLATVEPPRHWKPAELATAAKWVKPRLDQLWLGQTPGSPGRCGRTPAGRSSRCPLTPKLAWFLEGRPCVQGVRDDWTGLGPAGAGDLRWDCLPPCPSSLDLLERFTPSPALCRKRCSPTRPRPPGSMPRRFCWRVGPSMNRSLVRRAAVTCSQLTKAAVACCS